MRKIAIAYIDCDLYSSTWEVLSFIKPLLMKDNLIKFIPDFSYCWHGQVMRVVKK